MAWSHWIVHHEDVGFHADRRRTDGTIDRDRLAERPDKIDTFRNCRNGRSALVEDVESCLDLAPSQP